MDELFGNMFTFDFVAEAVKILNEPRTKQLILSLNTHSQLFDRGINSDGVKLSSIGGDYAPYTLDAAKRKGKPKQSPSIINLNDTNRFYESFRVQIKELTITIKADDSSNYTIPLTESWGKEIIGLTEENLATVEDYVAERLLGRSLETI